MECCFSGMFPGCLYLSFLCLTCYPSSWRRQGGSEGQQPPKRTAHQWSSHTTHTKWSRTTDWSVNYQKFMLHNRHSTTKYAMLWMQYQNHSRVIRIFSGHVAYNGQSDDQKGKRTLPKIPDYSSVSHSSLHFVEVQGFFKLQLDIYFLDLPLF